MGVDRFAVVGVSAGGAHALGCAVALGERVTAVAVSSMPGPLDEVPGGWDALDRRQRPAAEVARQDPKRAAAGVVRYSERWLDEPTTFLGGGTLDDRALLAEPDAGAMLAADVTEALRPGAGGIADDLVALWMAWGFRIAEVRAGVRPVARRPGHPGRAGLPLPGCDAAGLPGPGLARRRTPRRRSPLA